MMKTLYLDLSMGASGDMLCAALFELMPDRAAALAELNAMGIPGVLFAAEPAVKCGLAGTHMSVLIDGAEEDAHHHRHIHPGDIYSLIASLALPEPVRDDAAAVYRLIAEAEGRVHGKSVEHVHLHEVGALDAVADVAGVCLLMHRLAPDAVCASPVSVGTGSAACAHGVLPVPAPATEELLRGIPTCPGGINGELCTPTGAALLRHFVRDFGPRPEMAVFRIGSGCGKRDFDRPNCLRALLGESGGGPEQILELRCNLDDMSAEDIGFALEELLRAGALDAFTTPIGMKKSRPGTMLTCLCRPETRGEMLRIMLKSTTTLGVRISRQARFALEREERTVQTRFGPVRVKFSHGLGVSHSKPEFDELSRLAREHGVSLREVRREAEKAADSI